MQIDLLGVFDCCGDKGSDSIAMGKRTLLPSINRLLKLERPLFAHLQTVRANTARWPNCSTGQQACHDVYLWQALHPVTAL